MNKAPLTLESSTLHFAPPPPGTYKDSRAARAALQERAKWHGYAFVTTLQGCGHGAKMVVYVACTKGPAFRTPRMQEQVQRESSTSPTGCPFLAHIRPGHPGEWHIHWTKVIEPQHNHAPSNALAFAAHRRLTPVQHDMVRYFTSRGMTACQHGSDGMRATLETQKDIINDIAKTRRDALFMNFPVTNPCIEHMRSG